MANEKGAPGIWVGQTLHFTCLAGLLLLAYLVWRYLGARFPALYWSAVLIPVVHQVFVWLAWRLELHRKAISRSIRLYGYVSIFVLLFASRFISLILLAWVDRGSLGLSVLAMVAITLFLSVPSMYAFYSVKRYFGMTRAAGADHFESKYLNMPLVEEGIFRYTKNGMYLYAFLAFPAIAIGFNSSLALVVAAFSQAYIWVHFHATEKPDMEFLYGISDKQQ
jgi:hypothetical protein